MLGIILATMLGTAEAHPRHTHVHAGQPGHRSHVRVPVRTHAHRDYAHHNRQHRPAARHGGSWLWVRGHWARCHGHQHWVRGHWEFRRR